jgi:hypothetical protein
MLHLGKKKGKGKYYYLNGNSYIGEWDDNLKNGQGIYNYKSLVHIFDFLIY